MKTRCIKADTSTSWAPLPVLNRGVIHSATVVNRAGEDIEVAYTGDTTDTAAGAVVKDGESIAMRVNHDTAEISVKCGSEVPDGVNIIFDEA